MKIQSINSFQSRGNYKKSANITAQNDFSAGSLNVAFKGFPGTKKGIRFSKILSKIFGTIEERIAPDRFRFITRKNRKGIRVEETKIFPGEKRVTVATFEKDGKTPRLRQTYEKNGRKWKMVKESDYLDGQHFFSIEFYKNKKYQSVVANSNTEIEIETGRIGLFKKLKPETRTNFPTVYLNKFSEHKMQPMEKRTEGVVYTFKMKDLEALKKSIHSKSMDSNVMVLENPNYDTFVEKTKDMPVSWIVQNLNNVKNIPADLVKGFRPEDMVNLFLIKSKKVIEDFNLDFDEIGLSMLNNRANKNTKSVVKNFWNVSMAQRDKIEFSGFDHIVNVIDDEDFKVQAKYLRHYSQNLQIDGAFKQFISRYRLKPIDLTEIKLNSRKGRKKPPVVPEQDKTL